MTERVHTGPTIVQVDDFWIVTWDGETLFDVFEDLDAAVGRVARWWAGC